MTRERRNAPSRPGRYGLPDGTFAVYEWKIHQLLARDPEFRMLCKEHEEALRALEHFRTLEPSHPHAMEYAALVKELEVDILQELKKSLANG